MAIVDPRIRAAGSRSREIQYLTGKSSRAHDSIDVICAPCHSLRSHTDEGSWPARSNRGCCACVRVGVAGSAAVVDRLRAEWWRCARVVLRRMDGFDFTAEPAAEPVAPLEGFDFSASAAPAEVAPLTGGFDFGAPAEEPAAAGGFDFGAPAEEPAAAGGFDFGAPAEEPAAAGGALDMMAGFQTEELPAAEAVSVACRSHHESLPG